MILFPNAKINIGLNVLFKRDDGFHELETLMYPVPLTDILILNKSDNQEQKLNFSTSGLKIDGKPENNLIVKAYHLLDIKYNLPSLDIHLHKIIPFGAGLGGGSADAAFAIKGICELCQLKIPLETLEAYAAELGSDCAFFIQNIPAIAKGRGEILERFTLDLSAFKFAIIIPPIPINTTEAYRFVKPFIPSKNLKCLIETEIVCWKNTIVNNFEDSVFAQFSEIKCVKETLYETGAVYAALSGSGSAVFGIFTKSTAIKNIFPATYFIWMS